MKFSRKCRSFKNIVVWVWNFRMDNDMLKWERGGKDSWFSVPWKYTDLRSGVPFHLVNCNPPSSC